ncbi:MAG: hypothetical protein IPM49_05325 [Flavobacteriales bacterium]|nr:hypothetical protein [Flavobacteriales bacterium]
MGPRSGTLLAALLAAPLATGAQSLAPRVVATAGASVVAGPVQVAWTVGEPAVTIGQAGTMILTQGFHQPGLVRLRLGMRAFLQGPYNTGTGRMNDGLRVNGWVPLIEPYTGLGYAPIGGGGEAIVPAVLATPGPDAIIDWVFLELRDKADHTTVLHSRSALLQADGDIVDTDGSSPVSFPMPADEYFIAVHHRNHLAVLTLSAIALSASPVAVDLTNGSTATYGMDAQRVLAGVRMLWSGDVTGDGVIKYAGAGNDRDPILVAIGGAVPTATTTGYLSTDVNLDGIIKYAGAENDRDPILQNIGGVLPTGIRNAQLP